MWFITHLSVYEFLTQDLLFAEFVLRPKCLLKSFTCVRKKKRRLNYMWKRTGQRVCLFCFWDYPDYLGQINLVLDTYQPLLSSPPDTPPPLWPTITFYPESSNRTGDGAGSERSHLIGAHSGMRRCGRRDWDGIGSDLRQWEETLTMNVLRTHVYNDGGREETGAAQEHWPPWVSEVTKFKEIF